MGRPEVGGVLGCHDGVAELPPEFDRFGELIGAVATERAEQQQNSGGRDQKSQRISLAVGERKRPPPSFPPSRHAGRGPLEPKGSPPPTDIGRAVTLVTLRTMLPSTFGLYAPGR